MIVRCADCGFLQERDSTSDWKKVLFLKVSRERRGNSDRVGLSCFKEVPCFGEKTHQEDRECDVFVKWVAGWSPKEHDDMQMITKHLLAIYITGIAAVIAAIAAILGLFI